MTRRVGRAIAVALMTACAAVPAASAAPASRSQSTSAQVHLASQTPAVEPGGDFTARLRVSGAPAGSMLQLKVHDRTTTRSSFQQTLDGKGFAAILKTITVPAVADATGSVPVTFGTRSDATGDPDRVMVKPGVYPVEVALRDPNQTIATLITYLIVLRAVEAGPPLGVAMIVRLGATDGPAIQPDGATVLPTGADQGMAAMASVLTGHPAVPVTMLATPERLAAVSADVVRKQLLGLALPGRQVAPATFVPVDEQAWLGAGLDTDLNDELDAGLATLSSTLGPPARATWVADGPVAPATATWLAGRGVRTIVVPDDGLSPLDPKRFNTTLVQPFMLGGVDDVHGVVADRALADHLGKSGDAALDAGQFLADLAILDLDLPKATRLAVVEVPSSASPAVVDAVMTGIQSTRTLRAGTIDQLVAAVPTAGSKGETDGTGSPLGRTLQAPASGSLGSFASHLRTAREDVTTYRGALDDGSPLAAALDRRILAAGDRSLTNDEQVTRLEAVSTALRGDLAKVEAPPRQTITFTARDGVVGLAVRNRTGHAVHVVLHLDGPRLELPGHPDGLVSLVLAGDEDTTHVQIDVRARASGDSALDVLIQTPDGRITLGRTRITVRSTALSGVGIVLSVGALTFLLVWWGRHTLQERRARRRRMRHAVGSAREDEE